MSYAYHFLARKSKEGIFRVLFRQFCILYQGSMIWSEEEMYWINKTCFILHNVFVEVKGYVWSHNEGQIWALRKQKGGNGAESCIAPEGCW